MRVIDRNGLVYESIDYSMCLSHHGILGQKWGKQNGPPYPLGASDHSAAEKKAGWKKSLDNDGSTVSKRQLKKDIKAKKEDVDYAQRSLNQANAQLKADRLSVAMTKRKLKKLEAKGKTDESKNKRIAEERQILEDFKKYAQKSKINVEKAEAIKVAAIMDLTEAQLKLDLAKAKKVIDGYTREQIDSEKKRLGNDVYGSKANKYVDKYPDVRKAKIEFDMRSDQVAKELQKKYPPNSEKSRRAGMDDPDTFWNEMKKDKELQRLEKEYHDTLRKHNVSDRQAVKSLKLASRASSMRSSGMSYAEIAKKLGIPESSVGYYLNM